MSKASSRKFHFIYVTTNKVNGMKYLGLRSSDTLDDSYLGSGKYLKRAVKKYGCSNFVREITHLVDSREELYGLEAVLITQEIIDSPNWYNQCGGGKGPANLIVSEETKEKHRKNMRGNRNFLGHKHTEETKLKISNGVKTSPKYRRAQSKVSESLKGNKRSLGYRHTEESKKKMSKSQTGRKHSAETKAKISESNKLIATEEFKEAISVRIKNWWNTAPMLACPHCGKETKNAGTLSRWHNDNCKEKTP